MEELFIKKYEFEKKADKKLSNNIMQWQNEILETLYQQFPELSQFPQAINYISKNDDKRSAAGRIDFAEKISIPFIIDSGKLKPMIVFYPAGGSISDSMPLSQLSIQQNLSPQNFYKKLAPKAQRASSYSPSGTAVKSASFIESLSGKITSADKDSMLRELTEPRMLATLVEKKASYFIEKVSALTHSIGQVQEPIEVEEDIEYIYKQANLGWVKLSGNSKVYSPKVTHLREIDATGEFIKASGKASDPMEKIATVTGAINYKGSDFEILTLDKTLCKKSALLVDEKSNYIEDFTKEASWEYSDKKVHTPIAKTANPGDFILIKTSSKEYCGPIYVNSAYKEKDNWKITGINEGFTKLSFVENPRLSNSIIHGNTVYLPKAEFIKLSSKVKPEKAFSKKADALNYVAKRKGDFYLIGPAFEKLSALSGSKGPFNKHEASWNLLQLNASKDLVEKVANLAEGKEFLVSEELSVPYSMDTLLEIEKRASTVISQFIKDHVKGLVKEAAVTGNPETLDLVLGLNMINEDNMGAILQNLDLFDNVLNLLSRLWLMSLAGFKEVDEAALNSILSKLTKVKEVLTNVAGSTRR
jgi:hypothetical protein